MKNNAKVILSTLKSDSHTWNLVFLQMWLEEHGFKVFNLGSCVAPDQIIRACKKIKPTLIVISSVNGHGHIEALDLIRSFFESISPSKNQTKLVIGGKLSISETNSETMKQELIDKGFNGVFIGQNALEDFENYLIVSRLFDICENQSKTKSKVSRQYLTISNENVVSLSK